MRCIFLHLLARAHHIFFSSFFFFCPIAISFFLSYSPLISLHLGLFHRFCRCVCVCTFRAHCCFLVSIHLDFFFIFIYNSVGPNVMSLYIFLSFIYCLTSTFLISYTCRGYYTLVSFEISAFRFLFASCACVCVCIRSHSYLQARKNRVELSVHVLFLGI